MNKTRLEKDFEYCEAIIRENSSSFYKAFKNLPSPKARAVYAVYAFCRLADDAIDVENNPQKVRMMAEQLEAFKHQETPDEPMWRALRWTFDHFDLEIEPFEEMLIGQLQDENFVQPTTFNELLDYCYLVAGTVGLMLDPFLTKAVSPYNKEISVELGIAMQLTNILRDVGSDYRMQRIYLPKDLMIAQGVTEKDLAADKPSQALIALWEKLAWEAEMRYQRVSNNLEIYDEDSRFPVLLSLLYYRKIIAQIRKEDYHFLNQRVYVSKFQKLKLFLQAKWSLKGLKKYKQNEVVKN